MYIKLIRKSPDGEWLRGSLYIDGQHICSTLERTSKAILPLIYSVCVTQSPKFKRLLPIVNNVPQRSGIRIHVGTQPKHSSGCILVPNREIEGQITQLLLQAQQSHEDIRIDVTTVRPHYTDEPCPAHECAPRNHCLD